MKLHELIEELERDDISIAPDGIILFPPENANDDVTDCDSGDEDNTTINHLPGSQLRNDVEVIFDRQVEQENDPNFDEEDDLPLAVLQQQQQQQPFQEQTSAQPALEKLTSANWLKADLHQHSKKLYWKPQIGPGQKRTPLQLFSLFFDGEVIDMITELTNRYAAQKNIITEITANEIRCFIGVLILSGYVVLPRRYMYWEHREDTHNDKVADAISRDRFSHIMKIIHLCDNNDLDKSDRFAKVRPLYDALNSRFLKFAPFEHEHSIDEAMVPYFGRHPTKQYIRNKPIRWGYKLWVGTLRLGYIVWFTPYQGTSSVITKPYKELGLGATVVLSYADVVQTHWPNTRFHFFFDNFFSSMHLLHELKNRGIFATGTIRDNRILKCPLLSAPTMKKTERGKYDYRLDKDTGIVICRWHDNSIVTIASNFCSVEPYHLVKRFSQKEKKHIYVPQPNLIKVYNSFMGGVDRSDQNISLYRVSIRGKKWYFPLLAHGIDMAIQNAWQLARTEDQQVDQLEFRRNIACNILESFQKEIKRGPTRRNPSAVLHSRYDGMNHLVIYQEKQSRCGYCKKSPVFV